MKVWVLTYEVNAYDQYGEYFDCVFFSKPTVEMLASKGISTATAAHLIAIGGGRRKSEHTWYFLREVSETNQPDKAI